MDLTPEQIKLVKATIPVLEANGTTVTKVFYDNLLRERPELKNIFNEANQIHLHQPKALAAAVYAYAKNIENPAAMSSMVELIANKHASLYVQPEQYDIIGKYLLEAFGEVLGNAFTPELKAAWTAAYLRLASIFINREKALYEGTKGWTDWKEFRIAKMIKESDEIVSFYLEPVSEDSLPLPPFLPGQYISIQIDVPQLNHKQSRQYSLSDAPWPDYYRVSIKRDLTVDPNDDTRSFQGLVSNIMHSKRVGDIILVSHPMGDFFVNPSNAEDDGPLVLMSGGVGLTCLTSILNSLMSRHSKRQISWIHAAKSSNVRAFAQHIREIDQARENVQVFLFNDVVKESDLHGRDYHHEGYIDFVKLDLEKDLFLNDPKAQYYICGPVPFMKILSGKLSSSGVDPKRIHMELFGTGGAPKVN